MRDARAAQHEGWISLIEENVRHAQAGGALPGLPAEAIAFQIDAVLASAVPASNLGDPNAVNKAWLVLERLLSAEPGSE